MKTVNLILKSKVSRARAEKITAILSNVYAAKLTGTRGRYAVELQVQHYDNKYALLPMIVRDAKGLGTTES